MDTQIFYIGIEGLENSLAHMAAEILRAGGICVLPTDTLYGFSAFSGDSNAITRVNSLKRRDGQTQQIFLIRAEWLPHFLPNDEQLRLFIEMLSPAPVTFVINSEHIDERFAYLRAFGKTLAVRIPDCAFCDLVLENLGKPFTSSSVNFADEKPLVSPMSIICEFDGDVDGIFVYQDVSLESVGSTIVDVTAFPQLEILRVGEILPQTIFAAQALACSDDDFERDAT